MKITCVSDLHGHQPELPGGDLLIVAGDLTARDSPDEYCRFFYWIANQKYRKRIVIAGNHDMMIEDRRVPMKSIDDFEYLEDSGTEFEGLKIWGSPWTQWFDGVNPNCKAFMLSSEKKLAKKWLICPTDIDIMISHSPPYGILDGVATSCAGSKSLKSAIQRIKPSLLVCGHIHEHGGLCEKFEDTLIVNASYVDERYKPTNRQITLLYETGKWKEV